MEFALSGDFNYTGAQKEAPLLQNYIRYVNMEMNAACAPNGWDCADWQKPAANNIGDWGAIPYYYARFLVASQLANNKPAVPIGLILAAKGGKCIDYFASAETMAACPNAPRCDEAGRHFNECIKPLSGMALSTALWYQVCTLVCVINEPYSCSIRVVVVGYIRTYMQRF